MSSHSSLSPTGSIELQAEEWLVLLQSGDASEFDKRRMRVWISESKEHLRAFERLSQHWNMIPELMSTHHHEKLLASIEPSVVELVGRVLVSAYKRLLKSSDDLYMSYSPTKVTSVFSSIAFVVAIALTGVFSIEPSSKFHSTTKGEISVLTLKDGSGVTLGADSSIEVIMSSDAREVVLVSGQAFFSIKKDAERPFLVHAGETKVRVIGTQFDVNRNSHRVNIEVLEGIVQVSKQVTHSNTSALKTLTQLTLTAGQSVSAGHAQNDDFTPVQTIELNEISSWRDGRLRYNNVSLAEIAEDANRFFDGNIALASEELGNMKVTTAFRTDEIRKMVDDLSLVLPIEVTAMANNDILLAHKNQDAFPRPLAQ